MLSPNRSFAVTWVSNDTHDGFLHAYDKSGQLLGVAQVNQHGPIYVNHPRERHVPPVSVGINADGNIAVAYTIDQLLTGWVRTFNANAEPLMDEQVIAGIPGGQRQRRDGGSLLRVMGRLNREDAGRRRTRAETPRPDRLAPAPPPAFLSPNTNPRTTFRPGCRRSFTRCWSPWSARVRP